MKLTVKNNNSTLIKEILKRGRINNRIEYNYVIDIIVVAEQNELTTGKDTKRLNSMLGKYELNRAK